MRHECTTPHQTAAWLRLPLAWLMGFALLALGLGAQAQNYAEPETLALPAGIQASGGPVSQVGPGDLLQINVFGQPDLSARVTIDEAGEVTVPLIGALKVDGLSPSEIGRRIEHELRTRGFVLNPKVSVEVPVVRSRMVSLIGEVNRPGRYPLESNMTLLELLAQAGGAREGAADKIQVLRRVEGAEEPMRLERFIGNRQQPDAIVQDLPLQAGDVLILAQAPRFFVYGEVGRAGAYPMEPELDVLRALSLAGGLTPRASDRRIYINRTDPATGEKQSIKASLTDPVKAGDVVQVNERIF